MANHFESFPSESQPENPERSQHLLESFPWGDAGLAGYSEWAKGDPGRVEIMKDVIYTFLDQELRNTGIYESGAEGAAFPWTVIRVKELARALVEKYGQLPPAAEEISSPPPQSSAEERIVKKEFVMTSFLATFHGHPFTFCEEAMHQALRALPDAIRATSEGREPDDIEIYTLGSPTNELGMISPEFSERMNEDPFGALGRLYAGFVENTALQNRNPDQRTELNFTGISMGSNMAAEAAKALLDRGEVTQSREKNRDATVPHLTMNMYTPAGLNESPLRHAKIPVGFVMEGMYQLARNPGVRRIAFGEKDFLENIKRIYEPRGIRAHMESEQKSRKEGVLKSILTKISHGVPVAENLKANELIGLKDPTMFSFKRSRQAKAKRAEHGETLAGAMLDRNNPNRRKFGIQMSHTIPFFRPSEFKRWDRIAELLKTMSRPSPENS